jgi:DNA-binding NtrC family response regulator
METRLFGAPGNGATSAEKGNGPELKPRGTVLLNDAECLPAGIQCKLVQVLRRHVAGTPVSSTKAKPVCRILAATSADPADIATQKLLCEELYFQLSSSVIHLPPLRERLDDVPLLVEAFLADLSKEREAPLRISAEALEVMRTYPWPGNVRELERMLVHCSLLGTSVVGPEDLPEYLQLPRPEKAALTIALDMEQNVVPLQEVDRRYAAQVLKVCRGVKIRAAKLLKIDRHTLESLIRPLLGKHGGKKPSRQGRKK